MTYFDNVLHWLQLRTVKVVSEMECQELHVSGTLVWYYYICPREV